MSFKSSMPYQLNPQLKAQVDAKKARDAAAFGPGGINDGTPWWQRDSYLKATGQEVAEKPIEKIEWANGLGNNIDGRYENFQLPDELRYSENVVSNRDRTGMAYQNAARERDIIQSQQDLLTYGPAGKPKITNNDMNNIQDPNIIDPANVGESGQLNSFKPIAQQVAGSLYGNNLEKTAALSPVAMKLDPKTSYNAMDAYKSAMNISNIVASGAKTNYVKDTNRVNKALGLPSLPNLNSMGGGKGGSYSNPKNTLSVTPPSTTPSSTTPPNTQYDFQSKMGISEGFDGSGLKNAEHRNSFLGTYKRNKPSLEARIKDATAAGKTRKVDRLNKKLKNFEDYQAGGKGFIGRALQGIGNIFK